MTPGRRSRTRSPPIGRNRGHARRSPASATAATLVLLGGLYAAQGLPFGFFTQALPVLLRDAGLPLVAIGFSSLLTLPWLFKFVWGPFVDRYGTPRHWLLPLQGAGIALAAALAQVDLQQGLVWLLGAFFAFSLFASVQDVVTDALGVRVLGPRERGLANGLQVGAYRLGMMLGGGLLLYVYAESGSATMFVAMALLLLLLSLPGLWHRPPPRDAGDGRTAEPLRITLGRIRQRLRAPGALAFIGLIAVYKFGDSMGSAMVGPFLHDLGLSKQAIAVLKGTLGSGAALAGAALGGWLVYRLGRRAALLGLGLAQTLSLLPYGLAALGIGGMPLLWTACIGEHLFGSMATVALFALMMDAADPDHAGSDYSLYACAIVFVQGAAGLAAGAVGDLGGYPLLFALSALLSALGCWALVRGFDRGRGPSRLAAVWKS